MERKNYSIIEPIMFTASRLEVIANRHLFGPLKMTISSMKILRLLEKMDQLTPKEIMENIGGTKSNISQRLDLLEKKGYIVKDNKKSNDKRKVYVKLTATGKKKLLKLYEHMKKVKLELESNFSQKEIEQHYVFFEKLNKIIETKDREFAKCHCEKFFKFINL